MEADINKPSYWIRIPILAIDLIVVAFLYVLVIILFFSDTPTAAELGYSINSSQVVFQQQLVMLLGGVVWTAYSFVLGIFVKRSLGHIALGTKYQENTSRIKASFSLLLSPTFLFDRLLSVKIERKKKESSFNKLSRILAYFISVVAIPGMVAFIFLVGLFLLAPRPYDEDFTLCGERFCLVQPNLSCEKNLDLVRSRVVEIVGQNFTGTGFLISDSLVLTNYHVVEEESILSIRQSDGSVTNAVFYNGNPDLDMAVLIGQFSTGEHIQFVNPTEFSEGTTDLFAIGYPGSVLRQPGTGGVTVTSGIYSSFLDYPDYGFQLVQTDAAINSGNSGGPLVNKCGQVFGMVTLSEKYDPYTLDVKEGLGYAISSTTLVPEINRLSR